MKQPLTLTPFDKKVERAIGKAVNAMFVILVIFMALTAANMYVASRANSVEQVIIK